MVTSYTQPDNLSSEEILHQELLTHNITISKISEIMLEYVKYEICNNYCKYPNEWDREKENCELFESDICEKCPMNIL